MKKIIQVSIAAALIAASVPASAWWGGKPGGERGWASGGELGWDYDLYDPYDPYKRYKRYNRYNPYKRYKRYNPYDRIDIYGNRYGW